MTSGTPTTRLRRRAPRQDTTWTLLLGLVLGAVLLILAWQAVEWLLGAA